jgi:hypothetical protein
MENKIGIIGSAGHAKVVEALKEKGIDVVVTGSIEQDDSFDLNGVRYAPIKTEQRKHKHVSSKLFGIMAMASMMYMPYMNDLYGYGESRYVRKLPEGTDIVKEYGLIQNKQSRLSKWERDMVVRIFEKNYYRVHNIGGNSFIHETNPRISI